MLSDFRFIFILPVLSGILLQGCATSSTPTELAPNAARQRIDELSVALLALGEDIDHGEARRAATIAIEYPLILRVYRDVCHHIAGQSQPLCSIY